MMVTTDPSLISPLHHPHSLSPLPSSSSALTSLSPSLKCRRRTAIVFSRAGTPSSAPDLGEVRVCTNRTCRKQGSLQTLDSLSGLAPPNVAVRTCGCLGRCGSGPNLALLPEGTIVSHCSTAARAARVFCDSDDDVLKSLEAFALRKRAESELERGNFCDAELLLTQAIGLKPYGGVHVIYKDRSVARLGMCNYRGSLEDAIEAATLAPKYLEAYLCQGDTFLAMEQFDKAEKSYSMALHIDPSLRRSRSFKARIERLQQKVASADHS